MSWGSLRFRLVAGGIVAILVALTIAGIGLTVLFERHIARTIADDLDVHLKQLISGIDVDAEGRIVVARPPILALLIRFRDYTGKSAARTVSCCARVLCGIRPYSCPTTTSRRAMFIVMKRTARPIRASSLPSAAST